MNDFWYTAIFSSLVIASGLYAGWNFFKYLYDEDINESTRSAYNRITGESLTNEYLRLREIEAQHQFYINIKQNDKVVMVPASGFDVMVPVE